MAGRILPKDGNFKHGFAPKSRRIPEYSAWCAMRQRCYNPKERCFPRYGAVGITVCERWRRDFMAFYSDMGPRPSNRHSLDRYPNPHGNYEPSNCRWATPAEQMRNRRDNALLEFMGAKLCVVDWARVLGMNPPSLRRRLQLGWPIEKALTTPPEQQRNSHGGFTGVEGIRRYLQNAGLLCK